MAHMTMKRRSEESARPETSEDTARAGETAPSAVRKTLRVLERVAGTTTPLGVRELARELGYGKSTTSRILLALEGEGYIKYNTETSGYVLGTKVLHLASRHYRNLEIHRLARPHMLEALADTGETIFLGVLDGWDVVVLDRVDSPKPLRMVAELGTREPAYCTAFGKVLLAFSIDWRQRDAFKGLRFRSYTQNTITSAARLREALARVRDRGYAVDDQEHLDGVRCVACPVRNHEGKVIAAVSVSGPSFRLTDDRIENVKAAVQRMAAGISSALGSVDVPLEPGINAIDKVAGRAHATSARHPARPRTIWSVSPSQDQP